MNHPYDRWYQAAPCGLLASTPEGIVLEANDTFLAWTGYTADAVQGQRLASLLDPGSRIFFETRHNQALHLQGKVEEVSLTLRGADGTTTPVLMNSTLSHEDGTGIVHSAVFNASQRIAYERDLLQARRDAEISETRLRILQDTSAEFGVTTNDEEVCEAFVRVAREAFAAAEVAVLLNEDESDPSSLRLVAGVNSLFGVVPPEPELRATEVEVLLTPESAAERYPTLAQGLRDVRMEAISITPLMRGDARLGLLLCMFRRTREFDHGFLELQRAIGRQASQTLVRMRLQRELAHMALYDQLTGIPNRQFVSQQLDLALSEASDAQTPLTVLFIDVDEFKGVNDALGHMAGDAVLRELAQRLRHGVRAHDFVGRIGGDEFVAICTDADADVASTIAERVLELARLPIDVGTTDVRVSVSVGASVFAPDSDALPSADDLLNRADNAMYVSKLGGKDRLHVG